MNRKSFYVYELFQLFFRHQKIDHSTSDTLAQLLSDKVQRQIYDFDNHLDDISLDWSNQEINERLDT